MERDRIRAVTDFSRDIAVDASAGTGKTATLIARVTNLFLARKELSPDDVLLLTFTEKAAAEMKSRVVEGWERLLAACRGTRPDGIPFGSAAEVVESLLPWNTLLRLPEGAPGTVEDLRSRVGEMVDGAGRLSATTFHSFCARVLKSFPAEAGIDPRFEILPPGESSAAWDAAFRRFLREEFGRPQADPRWGRVLSQGASREAVFGMIRRLCLFQRDLLVEGPLDFGTPADLLAHLRSEYAETAAWFDAFAGMIADPGHEMAPPLREARDLLARAWEAVRRDDLEGARALAPSGAAAFAFDANRLRSRKLFPLPPGALTPARARDALRAFFEALAGVPPGDEAARFLVDRARSALRFYDEAKGSGLDFMDLLLRANALLEGKPAVAAQLAARFRYIFVDEFQDTDPLQARMLRILSAAGPPGRLFLVGDPKQSIYAFRRADIQVYHRFREEILSRGGEGIALVRNFRSRPELIESVNGLFSRVLVGAEDFAPPFAAVAAHRTDRAAGPPVTLYGIDESVAEAGVLAGLIRRIVGAVMAGRKGGVPARPASWRDIVVLYRSDTGGEVLSAYAKALDAAGIPYVVPSRKGFFLRQEVQDLRIVLSAIDAPADPSARYAALKTIFFGLSDEEILPLSLGGEEAVSPKVRDALAALRRLASRRGRVSLSGLLAALFRESGVEFVAARLPGGERIAQNLAKAADLARAFERGGPASVKAFLAELRRRAKEDREEGEFPAFDEGEDAVRISTIHAAKGLEFPVVILGNLSRGGKKGPEGLRVDRGRGLAAVIFPGFRTYSAYRRVASAPGPVPFEEWERRKMEAEERRLLYVAATRARDRLFLLAGGKGAGSELLAALRAGLADATDGGEGRCPVTGLAGRRRLFPEGGELLDVAVREPFPVAIPNRPAPAVPSFAEGWVPPGPEPPPPLPEPLTLREFFDREQGKRFGEKVHRLLEAAPPVGESWPPRRGPAGSIVSWSEGEEKRWDAIRAAIAASPFLARLRGAVLVGTEFPFLRCRAGWADEDRADLVVAVPRDPAGTLRGDPFPPEAAGAPAHREGGGSGEGTPSRRPGAAGPSGAVVEPPGGHGAHGAGRAPAEYWVIDYKTGRRERETEEAYARQVRGYMEILSGAWGLPVRGFVWYVETGETVEIR